MSIRIIIAFFILIILNASFSFESKKEPLAIKTLNRTTDCVLVKGENLATFYGVKNEGIRVFAYKNGQFQPIPFQIDERDGENMLVLPMGKEPNFDRGKFKGIKQLEDRLDENDEIIFMACDLGDKISISEINGYSKSVEVEVVDPLTDEKGWAYIMYFENPPPLSSVDYVDYNAKEDRITAEYYTLGYPSKEVDRVYYNYLSISPAAGGNGKDIVDRLKIRFWVDPKVGGPFEKNEDDFRSTVIAYKDGAVRVIRRVANSMMLILNIHSPKIIVESYHYRDSMEAPNVLYFPVSLGILIKDAFFRGGTDFNENAYGMKFYSSMNDGYVILDGKTSPEEKYLKTKDHKWHCLTGEQGTFFSRLVLGPEFPVQKGLYYRDDSSSYDPPEEHPGQTEIDYTFEGILELKRGKYTYNSYLYFPIGFQKGDEQKLFNILDHPLKVFIKEIP